MEVPDHDVGFGGSVGFLAGGEVLVVFGGADAGDGVGVGFEEGLLGGASEERSERVLEVRHNISSGPFSPSSHLLPSRNIPHDNNTPQRVEDVTPAAGVLQASGDFSVEADDGFEV